MAGQQTSTVFTLDTAGHRSTATTSCTDGTTTTTSSLVRHYADASDNPAWTVATDTLGQVTTSRYAESIGADLGTTINDDGSAALTVANLHGDVVTTVPITATAASGDPAAGIDGWSDFTEYGAPRAGSTTTTTGGAVGYGWLGAKQRSTTAETAGLTLMGDRLYNPTTGRFTSLDPEPGGNATAYSYPNDPINMFDLDGRFGWGHMWRWVNKRTKRQQSGIVSGLAIAAAGMNRSRCRREWGMMTCTGGRVHLYGRGGTTFGSVYMTGRSAKFHTHNRINHERAHSRQWRKYGFGFGVRYLRAGSNPYKNRYERQANLRWGGY